MSIRFEFDPFDVLFRAFRRRCKRRIEIEWCTDLKKEEGAWGRTHFDVDPVYIEIDVDCPIGGAVEVLAHELAHVIAGEEAGHGGAWEREFDWLMNELHQRAPIRHWPRLLGVSSVWSWGLRQYWLRSLLRVRVQRCRPAFVSLDVLGFSFFFDVDRMEAFDPSKLQEEG